MKVKSNKMLIFLNDCNFYGVGDIDLIIDM